MNLDIKAVISVKTYHILGSQVPVKKEKKVSVIRAMQLVVYFLY